jgi:hypothetical protein
MSDRFGTIIDANLVEEAAAATIKRWLPTYLAELERQRHVPAGQLAIPRGPTIAAGPESPFADQAPGVWLWVGDAADVELDSDRRYTVAWPLTVHIVIGTSDHARTVKLGKVYAAAIRVLLIQQGDLGGVADMTLWDGERYDAAPPSRERTEAISTVTFRVQCTDVATWGTAPLAPIDPPEDPVIEPPDAPTITSVDVTLTGK